VTGPVFDGCNFNHVGTIVRGPSSLQPVFRNTNGTHIGVVADLRDLPGLMQQLGLRAGTDPAILLEALRILQGSAGKADHERIAELQASRLERVLALGSSVATIYPVLAGAVTTLMPIVLPMVG
jgi:hypothetical protein